MGLAGALTLAIGPLAASAGGARCWLDHGAVVVSAAYGAIADDFVLDLSRPRSTLHDTVAQAHDITGAAARYPLRLAGEPLGVAEMDVANLDAKTRRFDTSIAGIIGLDVLARFDIFLDLRHGDCRLQLIPARGAPRTGIPSLGAELSDGRAVRRGLFAVDTGETSSQVVGSSLAQAPPEGGASVRLRAAVVSGALYEQVEAEPSYAAMADGLQGALGTGIWSGGRLGIRGTEVRFRPGR